MSLHTLAQDLASKGRHGDTMLVHMSPGEVKGLQALAMSQGGSLTTNPDTGLPEAFKLKQLLPLIAGFALGPAGFGLTAMQAGLTVGGIEALRTGDLGRGIMSGLGAFGGAGLGGSLAGASSVGAEAAKQTAMQQAAASQAAGLPSALADAAINPDLFYQAPGFDMGAITGAGQKAAADFASQGLGSQLKGSLASVGQPGGFGEFGSNLVSQYGGKYGAMAAATPTVLSVSEALTPKVSMPTQTTEPSTYAGPYIPSARSVRFKRPEDTSTSEFTFFNPSNPIPGYGSYYAAAGGMMDTGEDSADEYAEGGQPQERGPVRMPEADYIPGTDPEFNYGFKSIEVAKPVSMNAPASPGGKGIIRKLLGTIRNKSNTSYTDLSGYEYDPMTQQLVKKAGGGLTALAGGRYLQGPGDGTSDSIPAVIGNKQPARLADGEFVIDARTVSELGNGSSKAGAQKLYKMMDRVHAARKKAGRGQDSKAERYMPA